MADEFDESAERLLPCHTACAGQFHDPGCEWRVRGVVAAALREAGKRGAELKRELNRISAELGLPPGIGPAEGWLRTQLENYNIALMERDDLRREVERLKNLIGIIQRESLNDLDLISKFNAEIAALKAEVQRLTAEEQAWRKFTTEADRTMDKADAEIAALKAKLAEQTHAANHWFEEANKNRNAGMAEVEQRKTWVRPY